MKAYSVYRFESEDNKVVPIGTIFEFRREDRGMNRLSLTKLARTVFGRGTSEIIFLGEELAMSSRRGARTGTECQAG